MSKFIIEGPNKLHGEIPVNGAKNAALKIMAASLLSEQTITIHNVPAIEDVHREAEILEKLGASVNATGHSYEINTKDVKATVIPPDLMQKLRASIVLTGPMLARFGEVSFPLPGGDVIGSGGGRPINVFIDGFKAFGAEVKHENNIFHVKAKKLRGAKIFFPKISVTGTECLMMAATLISGKTTLQNTAQEPEIPALADYLNAQGAKIKGAGTSTIEIEGVEKLNAGEFTVMPDRIEAGSFALLAAACHSEVKITNCEPKHLDALWHQLDLVGVPYELSKNYVIIKESQKLKTVDVTTREYPGFATDLQAPYTVLMTQAEGSCLIHETIHDRRLLYTDHLTQMGANIVMSDPHRIVVNGFTQLHGRDLVSPDIRAGIAILIAGLSAHGETTIDNIYQIDRGYERIEERLQKIGAKIERA